MLNIRFFFEFVLIFSIIVRRKEKLKMPFDENFTKFEEKVLNSAREQKNAVATIRLTPKQEIGIDFEEGTASRQDGYTTWKSVIMGKHFQQTLSGLREQGVALAPPDINIYLHDNNSQNQALATQNAIIIKSGNPLFMENSVPGKIKNDMGFFHFRNTKEERYREALIVHEIGHLMHAKSSPNLFHEFKLLANEKKSMLDKREIDLAEKELGLYSCGNRLEFVAEAFTAMAFGRELSVDTVAAYIKWGGCTEVIPDDKLLQWADGREEFQDIGEGTIDRAHAIRERINAKNENLTYEEVEREHARVLSSAAELREEERNERGQENPHREHMERLTAQTHHQNEHQENKENDNII